MRKYRKSKKSILVECARNIYLEDKNKLLSKYKCDIEEEIL